ncbi:hypothetical protein EOM82_09590, partial [bacterium]|nr:hypothetical protein [bacterium]
MKKMTLVIAELFFLIFIFSRYATEYDDKEVKSILFYTVQSFMPEENDKLYDFETLTYSERITIQDIENYPDEINNEKYK